MSDKKPYFPFFVNIEGMRGMVIGGGKHAYEKVLRMQPYGAHLTVIAPEFVPEMENFKDVTFIRRNFQESDLKPEPDFVVMASDNEEEKKTIFEFCKERRIPINSVDDMPYCSYIYPALIAKGDLSIGICTGGASPAMTAILKARVSEIIPEHVDEILVWLEGLRPMMKERIPDSKKRAKIFRKIVLEAMERDCVLMDDEFDELLKEEF